MDIVVLIRSNDDKELFIKNNPELSSYSFYKYVNSENVEKLLNDKVIEKNTLSFDKNNLSEILTHMHIWSKSSKSNKNIVVIKYDCILSLNFISYVNTIIDSSTFDLFVLTYNFDSIMSYKISTFEYIEGLFSVKKYKNFNKDYFKNLPCEISFSSLKNLFGLSAYIISPNGANYLLNNLFPLCDGIISDLPLLPVIACNSLDLILNKHYIYMSSYVLINPIAISMHNFE